MEKGEKTLESNPPHPLRSSTPVPLLSITKPHHPFSLLPNHVSLQSRQPVAVEWTWTQDPHLGTGPPALGSGSQQGRHSGRSPLCCHSGLARRAVALGHTHPHLLHTPSPGSQPGKHSGKSRTGSHRPLCHKVPGSACTRPHLPRARGQPESHLYAPLTPTPAICSASLTSNTFTFPSPSFCLPVQSLRLLVCLILPPLLCYSNSPSSIPLPPQSLSFRSPS